MYSYKRIFKRYIINILLMLTNIYIFVYFKVYSESIYTLFIIGLNNWYLNILYNIIMLILFLQLKINKFKYIYLLLYQLLKYTLIFHNCIVSNTLITSLWVGTINIHPLLLYLSFNLIYIYINTYKIFKFNKTLISLLAITALSLGSLWGLQSFTWGYIWVSDGIEWILFITFLLIIYKIHILLNYKIYKYINIIYFNLVFLLLCIRLNIITTRHSFFLSNYFNYLILYTYCYLFIIKNIKNFKNIVYFKDIFIYIKVLIIYNLINNISLIIFFFKFITIMFIYTYIYIKRKLTLIKTTLHVSLIITIFFWIQIYTYYNSYFFINFNLKKHIKYNIYTSYVYNNLYNKHNIINKNLDKLLFIKNISLSYIFNYSVNFKLLIIYNLYYVLNLLIFFFMVIVVIQVL